MTLPFHHTWEQWLAAKLEEREQWDIEFMRRLRAGRLQPHGNADAQFDHDREERGET